MRHQRTTPHWPIVIDLINTLGHRNISFTVCFIGTPDNPKWRVTWSA